MVRWSQGRTCRLPVLKQLHYGMKILRRRQLLARVAWVVVAGIAEEDKYPAILNTLCTVRHASPLTVIAQCLMGVRPVEPGFKTFAIAL